MWCLELVLLGTTGLLKLFMVFDCIYLCDTQSNENLSELVQA